MRDDQPMCGSGCSAAMFGFRSRDFGFGFRRFSRLRFHPSRISGGLATVLTCCICLVVKLSVSAVTPLNNASVLRVTVSIIGGTRGLKCTK